MYNNFEEFSYKILNQFVQKFSLYKLYVNIFNESLIVSCVSRSSHKLHEIRTKTQTNI